MHSSCPTGRHPCLMCSHCCHLLLWQSQTPTSSCRHWIQQVGRDESVGYRMRGCGGKVEFVSCGGGRDGRALHIPEDQPSHRAEQRPSTLLPGCSPQRAAVSVSLLLVRLLHWLRCRDIRSADTVWYPSSSDGMAATVWIRSTTEQQFKHCWVGSCGWGPSDAPGSGCSGVICGGLRVTGPFDA